jgi:hypothetical protein
MPDRECQCKGIEPDIIHCHGTVESGRERMGNLRSQIQRQNQEAQHGIECRERGDEQGRYFQSAWPSGHLGRRTHAHRFVGQSMGARFHTPLCANHGLRATDIVPLFEDIGQRPSRLLSGQIVSRDRATTMSSERAVESGALVGAPCRRDGAIDVVESWHPRSRRNWRIAA